MRLSHNTRNIAKAVFAFVTIGLVSACASDNNVSAPMAASAFKAPAAFSKTLGIKTFRVNNSEGITIRLNQHILNIPAGAICELGASYGAGEWNKDCKKLKGSVVITATMMQDNDGHPYVDFQPAMRFAPDKEVMLFLRNGMSRQATTLSVTYCNNAGICYDEAKTDKSLAPFRVANTSMIGRRIKHFSGYMVTAGEPCNGTLTMEGDSWMCNEDAGMARRSGYMVASGLSENGDADDQGKSKNESDKDSQ